MSLINFTNKINSVMDFEVDNDVMHLSVYFNDFSTNPIIDIFTFMRPFRRGHIAVFVVHWADLARERESASQRRAQCKFPNIWSNSNRIHII